MGSCCGSKSNIHPEFDHVNKSAEYILPKIIVIPEDDGLVYFDISPTPLSFRLRNSLKDKFPNLVLCDGEKRIFNLIERMKERKFYIIIVNHISEETLRSLLINSKVKSIYFSLEEMNVEHYSKSRKIKGFFKKPLELKKAIFYDVRRL